MFRPQTCVVWLMFAVAVIRHTPPLQPLSETAIAFTVQRRSRAVKTAFKPGSAPLFPPTATNAVTSDPAQFAAATRLTTRFRRELGLRGASPARSFFLKIDYTSPLKRRCLKVTINNGLQVVQHGRKNKFQYPDPTPPPPPPDHLCNP